MRIAQISTPHERTPPEKYGGIERIVSLLTEGLHARGHDVTLFATRNSKTAATLRAYFPRPIRPYVAHWELIQATEMLKYANEFDVIHNHVEGVIPFLPYTNRPTLTTIHNPLSSHELPYFTYFSQSNYVTVSQYHSKKISHLPSVNVIHNGLKVEEFPYSDQKEDFMLFVGYFTAFKGMDVAVEVARRLKQRLLIIAKNPDSEPEKKYYQTKIAPFVDGDQICYIGELGDAKKEYFRRAKCLLFPTQGLEPFGLVMIEAMACGTLVIAFRRASVPEIVVDGVTGFTVNTIEEMIDVVGKLDSIDPAACRERVERCFTADVMIDRYLDLYQRIEHDYYTKK